MKKCLRRVARKAALAISPIQPGGGGGTVPILLTLNVYYLFAIQAKVSKLCDFSFDRRFLPKFKILLF